MFGKFIGEDEVDRGLDFLRGDGRFFVVGSKFRGFSSDVFEDVW